MNLSKDLYRCTAGSKAKLISTLLFDSGFKAVVKFRQAHYLHTKFKMNVLPRWLHYRARKKFGIDIDFRATIGPGFRIVHGSGLVIGLDVHAGENFTVYQGVTLGGTNNKTRQNPLGGVRFPSRILATIA